MKKLLKWVAFNACISGPLMLGYLTGHQRLAGGIIGIVYTIMILIYSFAFLTTLVMIRAPHLYPFDVARPLSELRRIVVFRWWNYLEPVYPFAAMIMGYRKIAVAMLAEIVLYVLLVYELEKSDK